jgi:hypothetical protein
MKTKILLIALGTCLLAACASAPNTSVHEDMVANADPYKIGVAGLSISNFVGFGMNLTSTDMFFAPRTNTVIMEFKVQGNTTKLYLTRSDRELLINAITSYLDSFESKTLTNDKKQERVYGTLTSFMEWGLLNVNARGQAKIRTGYEFTHDAPYFVLTVPEVENEMYNKGSVVKRSGYFQIFFTRSQLAAFGEMLIQEYLLSTLDDKNVSRASIDPDVY